MGDLATKTAAQVDFEFSQFLLGENTVANLMMVKERLNLGVTFGQVEVFERQMGIKAVQKREKIVLCQARFQILK